ncbi:hypothetical protein AVEN_139196-1 [Araneus ventricosus]|uniref:Secreted protein n=1 Tax=Araneus ventricosus TaxID=182803 RepID=A0A4Y2PSY7_ARAVE|nr:hypothetical protein AVEN_139196-1 [Araneus ventricosus]
MCSFLCSLKHVLEILALWIGQLLSWKTASPNENNVCTKGLVEKSTSSLPITRLSWEIIGLQRNKIQNHERIAPTLNTGRKQSGSYAWKAFTRCKHVLCEKQCGRRFMGPYRFLPCVIRPGFHQSWPHLR